MASEPADSVSPPCPSTPGQALVAVDEDKHGGSDCETGNNDHP